MRRRVAAAPVGRLGTVTSDGRPHLVPCCFALVGDTVYSAVDGKPKSTTNLKRLANIQANPTASLLVDQYEDDWTQLWWVRLSGPARVTKDKAVAIDALMAKYHQYRDRPPPGPVLAIEIDEWRSWAFTT